MYASIRFGVECRTAETQRLPLYRSIRVGGEAHTHCQWNKSVQVRSHSVAHFSLIRPPKPPNFSLAIVVPSGPVIDATTQCTPPCLVAVSRWGGRGGGERDRTHTCTHTHRPAARHLAITRLQKAFPPITFIEPHRRGLMTRDAVSVWCTLSGLMCATHAKVEKSHQKVKKRCVCVVIGGIG